MPYTEMPWSPNGDQSSCPTSRGQATWTGSGPQGTDIPSRQGAPGVPFRAPPQPQLHYPVSLHSCVPRMPACSGGRCTSDSHGTLFVMLRRLGMTWVPVTEGLGASLGAVQWS